MADTEYEIRKYLSKWCEEQIVDSNLWYNLSNQIKSILYSDVATSSITSFVVKTAMRLMDITK